MQHASVLRPWAFQHKLHTMQQGTTAVPEDELAMNGSCTFLCTGSGTFLLIMLIILTNGKVNQVCNRHERTLSSKKSFLGRPMLRVRMQLSLWNSAVHAFPDRCLREGGGCAPHLCLVQFSQPQVGRPPRAVRRQGPYRPAGPANVVRTSPTPHKLRGHAGPAPPPSGVTGAGFARSELTARSSNTLRRCEALARSAARPARSPSGYLAAPACPAGCPVKAGRARPLPRQRGVWGHAGLPAAREAQGRLREARGRGAQAGAV